METVETVGPVVVVVVVVVEVVVVEVFYTTHTRFRRNFGSRRMVDVKLREKQRERLNAPGSWRLYSRNKTRC